MIASLPIPLSVRSLFKSNTATPSPLDTTCVDGVTVVVCHGPELCGHAAARFARSAYVVCRKSAGVVVDLGGVSAIDAAGLRAIAGLARACRSFGGELRLCGATRSVRQLLAAAGVHRLADVFPTRHDAVFAA
jgi:anti-sigma B factor antagonist